MGGHQAVMMFEPDPEQIGPLSYEEVELDMDVRESVHEFDPDEDGRCRGYLIRHGMQGNRCNSTQRYSVFHTDDRQWCCSLSEQGIDCGHGEDYDYEGNGLKEPTYSRYVVVLEVQIEDGQWSPIDKWDFRTLFDLGQGEYATVKGVVPTA